MNCLPCGEGTDRLRAMIRQGGLEQKIERLWIKRCGNKCSTEQPQKQPTIQKKCQIEAPKGNCRKPALKLQPAPKSQPIPEWERNFRLWPQIQIAAGLNPLRFENLKPNPPHFTGDLNSSNRKPAGRNRRIRAARRPQIAESPATRPLSGTA